MLAKPTPKAELVANILAPHLIKITTHSADALLFLETEAPQFGGLHWVGDYWYLIVKDGYSGQEVTNYLNSYNNA